MIDLEPLQQQLTEMWIDLITYVPRLPGALLVLLIGWLVARFVRRSLVKLGKRIGFDAIVDKAGIGQGLADAEVKETPTEILASFIYWLIILNVVLIALKTLALDVVAEPLQDFIDFLPRILIAAVTFILGAVIARFISQLAQAAAASAGVEFHQTIGQLIRALLLIIVAIVAVDQLGLDMTLLINLVTYGLISVIAGLSLAFGLGGRNIARNVLAGFYARDMFAIGDIILLDDEESMLIGIGSVNSELSTPDGRIVVPNIRLTEEAVKVQDDEPGRQFLEEFDT